MAGEIREVSRKRCSVRGVVLLLGALATGVLLATRIYVLSELLFFLGLAGMLCVGVAGALSVALVVRAGVLGVAEWMQNSRHAGQQKFWASRRIRQISSYRGN